MPGNRVADPIIYVYVYDCKGKKLKLFVCANGKRLGWRV